MKVGYSKIYRITRLILVEASSFLGGICFDFYERKLVPSGKLIRLDSRTVLIEMILVSIFSSA